MYLVVNTKDYEITSTSDPVERCIFSITETWYLSRINTYMILTFLNFFAILIIYSSNALGFYKFQTSLKFYYRIQFLGCHQTHFFD